MLWAAATYGAGIITGFYVWQPPLCWLIAGIAFCASSAYFLRNRGRAAYALALCALVVLGAFMMQVRAPENAGNTGVLAFADGREVIITARVTKEGSIQERVRGFFRQKLDVETERIETEENNQSFIIHSGLRINLYARTPKSDDLGNNPAASIDPPMRLFRYGERLRFSSKLYRPQNYRNPGAFDYREYLAESGVVALGSAKAENVELLPGFAGNRAELWRTRVRHSLLDKIHPLWKPTEAATLDAILIGENSFLGRETLTDFQRTGTYHVLVISGLKIAILALVIFWLLRKMQASEIVASAVTVLITVAYALLTDVGAPVWRATLMLAFYLVARLFYRRKSVLNAIGAAALALLLIDPAALLGASFQLSFLCVLVITGIGTPVLERTTQPLRRAMRSLDATSYDIVMSPALAQLRLDLRMIAGRLQRFLGKRLTLFLLSGVPRLLLLGCEFVVISTVLQAGFTLPMAYYFHRVTLVSLPANILAVPLTEIGMSAAIAAVSMDYVSPAVAKIPAIVAGLAIHIMDGSVHWLSSLRIADTRVPTPSLIVIALGAGAVVLAMILSRQQRWCVVALGWMSLVVSAIWISVVPPSPQLRHGVFEITAIDVGQGDSILMVSPGGRTMLVDSGGIPLWMHSELDVGEDVVSPYLWSRGFHQIDVAVITHSHDDHMGGMAAVLANFHPRELWLSVDPPGPALEPVLRQAKALKIPIYIRQEGDRLAFGDASIDVLAPPRGTGAHISRPNDESLVMKVGFGATSALLEGDAERRTETQITEEHPDADLLKIAHHGSTTSTIPEWLAAVHPRFAVISVGARNLYGHPGQEVLNRLAEARVRTYRTDMDGAVTFYLDGKTVTAQLAALH